MDRIRVGAFEVFPTERQLCLAGRPVELGARAFDLLLVLAENPGCLVTKATLLERVWPRLVVDENNLPAQIASLRRVLGAGAIRTVPKFGYRLDLEVSAAGAQAAAPPPAPLPSSRGAPGRMGSLVGREEDLRAVREALERTGLLTVAGGAGIGKTRLAQEIFALEADRAGARTAWVPLEPLDDASRLPSAIALALGLSLPDVPDRFQALGHALEQVPALLFLDGAEHLGDALARPLAELLWKLPGLRCVVTSQAPLGITGETVYRLASLAVPAADAAVEELAQHGAVALFVLRASEADRRFELGTANAPLVADICRRLDGNPLALELAAARAPALGLATLRERLDDRFRLLKQAGRSGERHGVLQAAFDWSYGLLAPAEQRVFNRLGAFAGSFSLNAAARCVADEAVDTCGAIDLIGRLVDRSLVTVLGQDPPRYRLLETARCYANERLAATGELDAARGRMAETMLQLLDQAYGEYWSQDEAVWLSQYGPEIDNVRAAMEWARGHDEVLAISLYGAAWPLFVETDLQAEGRAGHDDAVALLSDAVPLARVARFWEAVATYDSTRQYDRARYAAELAAGMHAATGDARSRYFALMQLALNLRDDEASARAAFDQARAGEDPAWPARLLAHGAMTEGALLTSRGEFAAARDAHRRALNYALTTSERQALAATVSIVELDIACGATEAALQLGRPLELSLRRLGRRETRFELLVLVMSALLLAGETDEARRIGAELHALALRRDRSRLYVVLDAMALLACREGRFEEAARIAACADTAHESHGQAGRRPAEARVRDLVLEMLEGRPARGRPAASIDVPALDEGSACALALGLA